MKKKFTEQDIEQARDIYLEHSSAIEGAGSDIQMKVLQLMSLVEKLSDIGTPVEDGS